jgi:hypothetical protein
MSDSKRTDHWDLLASVLGAEPQKKEPDEPAPQVEEESEAIFEVAEPDEVQDSPTQAVIEPVVTRPPRSLSNWDALAMDLGIEVKPEPIPAPPPAPVQLPMPKQVENKVAIKPERAQEFSRPAGAGFGKQPEQFENRETLPDEAHEEASEKKSRHRRRRRRKGKDTDRPSDEIKKPSAELGLEAPTDSDLIDISLEIADKVSAEIEHGPAEGESETQPQKRHRSRRGSRKRKKKGTETNGEKSVDEKKSGFTKRAEPVPSADVRQESEGDDERVDEEHDDGGLGGGKSRFRAIPTWEEAVGCIVAKNMESRPRRQGGGPPRSRSGGDSHKRRRK